MSLERYLRCTMCGWSFPIMHTPDDERCSECDGVLQVMVIEDPEPARGPRRKEPS